jgi:hypothetical protein
LALVSFATTHAPTKDAMSDPSAVAAIQNEKASAAQEWREQDDEHTNGTEQKLNDSLSQAYPARTIVIDRKAKRKDDGPLEIFCGWIVEHQIGMIGHLYAQFLPVTDLHCRTLRQPFNASLPHTFMLPPRSTTHSQVLRTLLL